MSIAPSHRNLPGLDQVDGMSSSPHNGYAIVAVLLRLVNPVTVFAWNVRGFEAHRLCFGPVFFASGILNFSCVPFSQPALKNPSVSLRSVLCSFLLLFFFSFLSIIIRLPQDCPPPIIVCKVVACGFSAMYTVAACFWSIQLLCVFEVNLRFEYE